MMARLVLITAVAVVSLYAVSSEAAIPLEEPFPGKLLAVIAIGYDICIFSRRMF